MFIGALMQWEVMIVAVHALLRRRQPLLHVAAAGLMHGCSAITTVYPVSVNAQFVCVEVNTRVVQYFVAGCQRIIAVTGDIAEMTTLLTLSSPILRHGLPKDKKHRTNTRQLDRINSDIFVKIVIITRLYT
jgi:hypothetical protein